MTFSQDRELYGVEIRAEPNFPTLGKKAGGNGTQPLSLCSPLQSFFVAAKLKNVTQKIRDLPGGEIEQLFNGHDGQSPLTTLDGVLIEVEDLHIVYRVASQTRFEATAEQGVRLRSSSAFVTLLFVFSSLCYSITLPMPRCKTKV